MKYDVIVAGAGIIGVSTALHLQAAGRSVLLFDKAGKAGTGTSYGNAGLVERASIVPYGFPQSLPDLIRYGLNRSVDVRFDPTFLPKIAPFLFAYWRNSTPANLARASRDLLPLIEASVAEHDVFIKDQPKAAELFSRLGWIKAYADEAGLSKAIADAKALAEHGLNWTILDRSGLKTLEGDVSNMVGAIHWLDPITASDPGAVTAAYADLFVSRGGVIAAGDASSLVQTNSGWRVTVEGGVVEGDQVVVTLGPWSAEILRGFGYRFPLQVKRGYHMHYRLADGAQLGRPLLDATTGYVLAPMRKGIRLTTAVELAPRDAAPTPIQLAKAEAVARTILPLAERVDEKPWIGFRPVFADMRPAIGKAPRHSNLWLGFGHGHHGFTMGPATGRLLADLMTGRPPRIDPAPYSPARFRA